jgi:hypothetical protein
MCVNLPPYFYFCKYIFITYRQAIVSAPYGRSLRQDSFISAESPSLRAYGKIISSCRVALVRAPAAR